MTFKNKRRWLIILQYCMGWTIAFLFLSIVRGEGTIEQGSVQFEFWDSMLTSLAMGPFFGSISGAALILTEEYGYKHVSFPKLLVLRVIYCLLFVTLMVLVAFGIYGKNLSLMAFAFEPGSFAIYFYIVSVDIFMFGLRQVSLHFGGNNLSKLMFGKFYNPHEEERIFMFLDLQSSTTHAERLGHIKYSKMIQDCFNDLGVVVENESEIYQYVGDEVVLTWKLKDGLRNQNCLRAYFNFKGQLDKRSQHYLDHYNCQPHFKAGINHGLVTVAEIGKFKKEIAYHGDAINTAARIQAKCNEFKEALLISENLKLKLDLSGFSCEELGSIELKGKKEQVIISSVHELNG